MKAKILNYFKKGDQKSSTYYNQITRLKNNTEDSLENSSRRSEIVNFMFNQSITASSDK